MNSSGARSRFLSVEYPPFGPGVAAQPVALGGVPLVGPGPGDDHRVGDVGVLVLDRGPGAFQGGDGPAAVFCDAPGFCHDRVSFVFSVCTLSGGPVGGWGPRAGRGRSRLPAVTAPGFAEAPRARVGPQDAFAERWKGSWGALAGGGAGPYAARPPPGTAPSWVVLAQANTAMQRALMLSWVRLCGTPAGSIVPSSSFASPLVSFSASALIAVAAVVMRQTDSASPLVSRPDACGEDRVGTGSAPALPNRLHRTPQGLS